MALRVKYYPACTNRQNTPFLLKIAKRLQICPLDTTFLRRLINDACQVSLLHLLTIMMEEQKTALSEQLMTAEILVKGQTLASFRLEMNEQTMKILDNAKEKQHKMLKLKEVNEELLRMVVKL